MTDVEVIPARDDGSLDGPRAWCHVMYGLHALSAIFGILTSAWIVTAFLFSWPSIISVIINYLTRDKVAGTWLATHWRWQMRTFWFAALWLLVTGLLFITFIGIPLAGAACRCQPRPEPRGGCHDVRRCAAAPSS